MEKLLEEWRSWQRYQAGCYRAMEHYQWAGWLPEAREKQEQHRFAHLNAMSILDEINEEWS